ncbi:hypothetical protein [Microbacterium sp. NPDC097977]|uniref:hypothetical protein n=1 Tax=Microbacterium sp. NPDC097977 TaxID=3155686 RepID=UPI003330BD21
MISLSAATPESDVTKTWEGVVVTGIIGIVAVLITALVSLVAVVLQARRTHSAWLRDKRLDFYSDVLAVVDDLEETMDQTLKLAEELRRLDAGDTTQRGRIDTEQKAITARVRAEDASDLSRRADILAPERVKKALAVALAEVTAPGTLAILGADEIAAGRMNWQKRMGAKRDDLVDSMRSSLETRG